MWSEKIINYRVTYPSKHCCQISIIDREKPGASDTVFSLSKARTRLHLYLFTLKFVYTDATVRYLNYLDRCIVIHVPLYQFDKKLTKHFPANICLFKFRIVTLR